MMPGEAAAAQLGGANVELKPGWLKRAGIVLMALSPLAIGYATGISICPSAFFLHHACPGCGLTRATVALVRGDLGGAMALNPLAPLVCPFLVGVMFWAAFSYVRFGRMRIPGWVGWPVAVTAVALNLVWAARLFGVFGGMPPI